MWPLYIYIYIYIYRPMFCCVVFFNRYIFIMNTLHIFMNLFCRVNSLLMHTCGLSPVHKTANPIILVVLVQSFNDTSKF